MGSMTALSNTQGPPMCREQAIQQLTTIFGSYLPSLTRMAARIMSDADAEDTVQDAFLSAYSHVNQYRGHAKMSTWVTAIVINAARMKVRARPWAIAYFSAPGESSASTVVGETARSPVKPRTVISKLGTYGAPGTSVYPTFSSFASSISTHRLGRIGHSQNSTSYGDNTLGREITSCKSTQETQTTAANTSESLSRVQP